MKAQQECYEKDTSGCADTKAAMHPTHSQDEDQATGSNRQRGARHRYKSTTKESRLLDYNQRLSPSPVPSSGGQANYHACDYTTGQQQDAQGQPDPHSP